MMNFPLKLSIQRLLMSPLPIINLKVCPGKLKERGIFKIIEEMTIVFLGR